MKRRDVLLGMGAAALARPAIAQPAQNRLLKFVPQANLTSLDPIWTTATVTRNHGYLVYDTLYGLDEEFRPHPQMAEGTAFEDGGRIATVTIRPGQFFHDGEPVRALDVVASLQRWMRRSPIGQKLAEYTDSLEALDDLRLRFRLKRPFPLLLNALGSVATPTPFIMPERLARTDPFQQVRESIGSGPFRFVASEFNSGSLAVYARNERYSPNPNAGPLSLTAGPKQVHFDRLEWHIIQDTATSTAALIQGEMDWFEQPTPENQLLLRRNRSVVVEKLTKFMSLGVLRFNHLHPPFDNPAIRRAILPAINQADFMIAAQGPDPENWRAGVGVFTPDTPMANDAGLAPLTGPRSIERARALLAEVGLPLERWRVRASDLSHGERKQLELAIALARQPKLLLLDEPMAGLGVAESVRMTEVLRALKGRIPMLLVEHDMDAVFSLADRVSVLVSGRCIASGPPEAIRTDPAVR
ncbi:MAG: ABC transporter substrate-binding protein, partial [Roseococcus sp.]